MSTILAALLFEELIELRETVLLPEVGKYVLRGRAEGCPTYGYVSRSLQRSSVQLT